jgi:hypothetical protein
VNPIVNGRRRTLLVLQQSGYPSGTRTQTCFSGISARILAGNLS